MSQTLGAHGLISAYRFGVETKSTPSHRSQNRRRMGRFTSCFPSWLPSSRGMFSPSLLAFSHHSLISAAGRISIVPHFNFTPGDWEMS